MADTSQLGQPLSQYVRDESLRMQGLKGRSRHYCSSLTRLNKDQKKDKPTPLRSEATIDVERIINVPYFARYQGKTQVYSLYKNDDISRRALHVTLVSRIARDIGTALSLNNDLIEAIALGHDLGHTPFGHLGESILDRIYSESVGLHFMHNVQSVRVLHKLCPVGVSLETLVGILCHNGELAVKGITPTTDENKNGIASFEHLDYVIEEGLKKGADYIKDFVPSTYEGAVVRFTDMIAYIGKDRNDTYKVAKENLISANLSRFTNSQIIKELSEDLVENSFEKESVSFSEKGFASLKKLKGENTSIYRVSDIKGQFGTKNEGRLYEAFLKLFKMFFEDLKKEKRDSLIFRHHIDYLRGYQSKEKRLTYESEYLKDKSDTALATVVVDYLQSMTDDYFYSLVALLCPEYKFEYIDYFDEYDMSQKDLRKEKI